MKIAIGFIGACSELYKYNKFPSDYDLFACSMNAMNDFDSKPFNIATVKGTNPVTVHGSVRAQEDMRYLYMECLSMIERYSKLSDNKYDIIIITGFNTILMEFPVQPGVYGTKFHTYFTCQCTDNNLSSIDIMSNTAVSINGERSIPFYAMEKGLLSRFLKKRFNSVILPEDMTEKKHELVMLIPSVIKVSNNPFSYVNYRSIFTQEERLDQTVKQLKDINSLDRGVESYLLEGSNLDMSMLDKLSVHTCVVMFNTDEKGDFYANKHMNKSIYEIYVCLYMMKFLSFDTIFKYGGRYTFDTGFNLDSFLQEKPVYKIISKEASCAGNEYVVSIIYSFPWSYKSKYIDIYNKIYNIFLSDDRASIEETLYTQSDISDVIRLEKLNVIGRDGIFGLSNPQ